MCCSIIVIDRSALEAASKAAGDGCVIKDPVFRVFFCAVIGYTVPMDDQTARMMLVIVSILVLQQIIHYLRTRK